MAREHYEKRHIIGVIGSKGCFNLILNQPELLQMTNQYNPVLQGLVDLFSHAKHYIYNEDMGLVVRLIHCLPQLSTSDSKFQR
jgi:hypothetical protein